MDRYTRELINHFSEFVSESRMELFQRVLSERTRYITLLLEDIYQSQNASAVLRTCDCTGIQDVHIVEQRNEYEINQDVALGSDKWLSLHYSSHITVAIEELRQKGYRIVATSPHKEGTTPESFDLEKGKAVLLFGTELNGLTDQALGLADEFIQIPMVGFTESFNISVAAAVILNRLRQRLNDSSIQWRLGDEEKETLLLNWLRGSIKMSRQIENRFREKGDFTF